LAPGLQGDDGQPATAQAHWHERLFAWMTLGDERNLVATWVAGQVRHACGKAATDPGAQQQSIP
jgi:hypothetical protein